jgi:putative chitinase
MDINKLKGQIPDTIYAQLDSVITKYGINTVLRLSHFLGQCAEETGNFTVFQENLNYSAERMCAVWPGIFPTVASAKPYEYNPQKLANYVYGGHGGNTLPDSGWHWRGRGCIQITFYDNYVACAKGTAHPEILDNPDLLCGPLALESAAWYWLSRGLDAIADKDVSDATIHAITYRVNGNPNANFDVRKVATLKFYNLLNS